MAGPLIKRTFFEASLTIDTEFSVDASSVEVAIVGTVQICKSFPIIKMLIKDVVFTISHFTRGIIFPRGPRTIMAWTPSRA